MKKQVLKVSVTNITHAFLFLLLALGVICFALFAKSHIASAAPNKLMGVNFSGPEWGMTGSGLNGGGGAVYDTSSYSGYKYFSGIGLTLIRMPFAWERMESSMGGPLIASGVSNYGQQIAAAQANNEKVLLDMHNYATFNSVRLTASDAQNFGSSWKVIATEFGNTSKYPAVWGYELMNEPNAVAGGCTTWETLAQSAVNSIRQVDTTHYILVPGYNWQSANGWQSNSACLSQVTDPANKLYYSAHQYFDSNYSGVYSGGQCPSSNTIGTQLIQPFLQWLAQNNKQGLITEYGVPNTTCWQPVLDDFLNTLYNNPNIIGATNWAAWPTGQSYVTNSLPPQGNLQDSILQKYPSTGSQPTPSPSPPPPPSPSPPPPPPNPGTDTTVNIDFSKTLQTLTKDNFAIDETGYPGGGPVLGNDTQEQQAMKNLGVGMVRIGLQYAQPGNPNSQIVCDGSGCDTSVSGDQYIQAIESIGADPIIIVPFQDPTDDANLVKHFNVDNKYGVKYWIVGNETQNGSPAYDPAFDAAYTAMKAVDPTIKIGGPAVAYFSCCNPAPYPQGDFIPHLLQAEGSKIDFIDYHAYGEGYKTKQPSDSALLANAQAYDQNLTSLRNLIKTLVPNRTIGIEVGEYNIDTDGIDPRFNTEFSAIWNALALGNIIKNGAAAMLYGTKTGSSQNLLGIVDAHDQPTPAYQGYGMFTGEGLFRGFGSQVVQTSSSSNDIVTFASNNNQNIVAINQNASAAHTIGFTVANTNATAADVWMKDATNGAASAPRRLGTVTIANGYFSYTVPAYAIVTFVLNGTGTGGGGSPPPPPANHCVASVPSALGTVTMTITVPQDGTYRVWSRIRTTNSSDNSYYFQIDGCANQVGAGNTQASQWTWVDYYEGSPSNTLDLSLSAGTHAITLIGTQPNVEIDRVILASDLNCIPTSSGDNCGGSSGSPSPNPGPSVTVTATTITASEVDLSWTKPSTSFDHYVLARDNGITLGSTQQTVYIDRSMTPGSHTYTVYGADASNNLTALGSITVTVPTPPTPPPPSPTVTVTTGSVSASKVVIDWTASPVPFDHYSVSRDATTLGPTTELTYTDTAPIAGNHTYNVSGVDSSGNQTLLGSVAVSVPSGSPNPNPNPGPPPPPGISVTATALSSNQVSIQWAKATGDVNHYRVQKDIQGITVGTTTTTSLIDNNVSTGKHTYSVFAVSSKGIETLLGQASVTVSASSGGSPSPSPPVTASVSQGKVTLSWTAPSSISVNHYRIQRDSAGITVGTTNQTTYTASVASGQHTFTVFAVANSTYHETALGSVTVTVP